MESHKQIEERAAAFLLKRDSGAWSAQDQAQLTDWFDAATVHRVAYLRLEAGWEEANRLKALGAGFPRGQVPSVRALEGTVRPAGRRRFPRLLAAAASVLVICAALLYASGLFSGQRYSSPVGGLTSVPLKDGSNVTLNTASKIRVRVTGRERRIDLNQGEAFFDVAKDPLRPFVVYAADHRITAVGTKFSVRRDGDSVRVIVTEGLVRLEDASGTSMLGAGTLARAAAGDVAIREESPAQAEDALSWRVGYVVFHETTLADAVAEFNRYNERPILIRDPAIAGLRLTGKFRSTHYETFVRLLEEAFNVRAEHSGEQIVLSGR